MMSSIACILCVLFALSAVQGASTPFASMVTVATVPNCGLFGTFGVGNLDSGGALDVAIPCGDGGTGKVALLKNIGVAALPVTPGSPFLGACLTGSSYIGEFVAPAGDDLVFGCQTFRQLVVVPNNDNGVFGSTGTAYAVSCVTDPYEGVFSADFSGDGRPDFISLCSGIGNVFVALYNSASGMTIPAGNKNILAACTDGISYGMAAADFDGANGRDLLFSCNTDNGLKVAINLGGVTGFSSAVAFGPAGSCNMPNGVAALNLLPSDNRPDAVAACTGDNALKLYTSTGPSTYSVSTLDATCTNPNYLTTGDVNSDGKDDIVAQCGSTIRLYLAAATGFEAAVVLETGCDVSGLPIASIIIADFTNDTKPDLLYACNAGGNVARVQMHKSVSPPPPPPMPPVNNGPPPGGQLSDDDHDARVKGLQASVIISSVFVATAYGLVYWAVAISPLFA